MVKKLFIFLTLLFHTKFVFGYYTENIPNGCNIFYSNMYPVFEKNQYAPFIPADETATCDTFYESVYPIFEINTYNCDAGYYLPAGADWLSDNDGCTLCPADSYCPGGTYTFNETLTQGIVSCDTGLYAPMGMWESAQCGRILHIGDNVVYLRSSQKTTPALRIDIDNDGVADFFGNMTTLDVPMTLGTQHKLKISYGGQIYSVYDDSVVLPTN